MGNFFLILILYAKVVCADPQTIRLKTGYVSKVSCEGRLFVSAIGNESLVRMEALPKELGCAVILKPIGNVDTTNLILETSVGTIEKQVMVVSH